MARKETITKSDILNAAFEMAREEGFGQVSARTLAARAGLLHATDFPCL